MYRHEHDPAVPGAAAGAHDEFPTVESTVGATPLVRLQRMQAGENNTILLKLEGNNPAGSVKDRPALGMIRRAEERGEIRPGDTLIEATSGNTGIALAMAAAIRGYRMVLIMPEHMSEERRQVMRAFGAELIDVPREGGMETARDLALQDAVRGQGPRARPVRESRQPARALREPPAPRSGARATDASRTSSARWAPPARSWASRATSRK